MHMWSTWACSSRAFERTAHCTGITGNKIVIQLVLNTGAHIKYIQYTQHSISVLSEINVIERCSVFVFDVIRISILFSAPLHHWWSSKQLPINTFQRSKYYKVKKKNCGIKLEISVGTCDDESHLISFQHKLVIMFRTILVLALLCHYGYSHTYHTGSCPGVEPMSGFDVKQVSVARVISIDIDIVEVTWAVETNIIGVL